MWRSYQVHSPADQYTRSNVTLFPRFPTFNEYTEYFYTIECNTSTNYDNISQLPKLRATATRKAISECQATFHYVMSGTAASTFCSILQQATYSLHLCLAPTSSEIDQIAAMGWLPSRNIHAQTMTIILMAMKKTNWDIAGLQTHSSRRHDARYSLATIPEALLVAWQMASSNIASMRRLNVCLRTNDLKTANY